MQGMHRRSGIFQRLDEVLREEWRNEATVRRAYNLPLPGEGDVELEEDAAA
jgi:DNA sulfur modification protein DndC